MSDAHLDPERRHEFVLLFDVKNGNPNGDPDAGNLPRIDPETNQGLVTDVAIKRKVRDYLTQMYGSENGYRIFIQTEDALNTLIGEAFEEAEVPEEEATSRRPNKDARQWMCENYFDIRMFGAVLSTGDMNAGQVRGPVQIGFSRSIDPVLTLDMTITRQARTTEERMETGETEMGRKPIIPYGLYRTHGFFNPFLGQQTGVSSEDLERLWEALEQMFEFDRSAARGEMATQGLYVFSHEDMKGNARAADLFDLVEVEKREEVEAPRDLRHYSVEVDEPSDDGVILTRLVG